MGSRTQVTLVGDCSSIMQCMIYEVTLLLCRDNYDDDYDDDFGDDFGDNDLLMGECKYLIMQMVSFGDLLMYEYKYLIMQMVGFGEDII